MLLVSSCSCLYPIRWSQVLSWEWRCSWSSADRRCSNYIWVINNLIAYYSASYIRDLTVHFDLEFDWSLFPGLQLTIMPQSHPTTGPIRFLAPVRVLARKAEWSARRNFTLVLFSWFTSGRGPRTHWHGCIHMIWSNNSQDSMGTPCDARPGIVRAPHGNLQCFSYCTGPVRSPCGTCKGAVRHIYGHVRELAQPELVIIPHGRRIWPYGTRTGPLRSPHGLFTGCLRSINPYGARKLIMHQTNKTHAPKVASALAGMVLTSKVGIFRLQRQKS